MAVEKYKEIKFYKSSLVLIEHMNCILADYQSQGLIVTVRQLFYQLVTRNLIDNTENDYKRVADICNNGRLAGLIDWDLIEDRTREVIVNSRWQSKGHILAAAADSFHKDLWVGQDRRVFVIVEKEALAGVLEPVCRDYDCPLLPARGYPSVTSVRDLAKQHILPALEQGQSAVILHLGDHDPSGLDMTRDLTDRLTQFTGMPIEVNRIALNIGQIQHLKLPPNPAKDSDKRFAEYARKYGKKSWELDALPPDVLAGLLRESIQPHINVGVWTQSIAEINSVKTEIRVLASQHT